METNPLETSTKFFLGEVEPADLPSIGTLHPRAFHNDWHRLVFPDTPTVREWWAARYAQDISNPTCVVLKAADERTPHEVVGVICFRKMRSDEKGAGMWTAHPRSADHDAENFEAMLKSMVEYREKLMLGRPHYNIEHFGIDVRYQKAGLGSRMLSRVLEIADKDGVDTFVQANEYAEAFYKKFGFVTEHRLEMPGGMAETFLVRHARQAE